MVATVTAPAVIAAEVPTDALAPVAMTNLFPAVFSTTFPFVAVMLPNVDVILVPAIIAVVAVTDPGATIADGKDKVIVLPDPVEVIWLAVPRIFMFPPVGLNAPPEPPVNVTTPPDAPEPKEIQLPVPGHI